eukprot:gnl/TRDRNA2_/TRDRNA2_170300_c0_seq2.p1 gnl/TRDRNA2_/TRDRNA2_170300_c0~~gnl/TRDRNA2_/TRDRNA2_170300_c0_seq2.p1  ORF type:complete len:107 (+),score=18.93 gnl/TRDRNA2_/TRDRNA2_170300_c0_seq2:144-464(+)
MTAMFDPVRIMSTLVSWNITPKGVDFLMLLQCIAATGQIVAGFAMLAQAEATRLISCSDEFYAGLHALLEACRTAGDAMGAHQVQSAVQRLGLIALVPAAAAFRGR